MAEQKIGTREEWLAGRLELLEAEKELTRRSDELARRRRELPWVRIEKEYRFDTDDGPRTLAELFDGRSQLLVYHFMFGPEYTAGCPNCSAIADGFDGLRCPARQPRRHPLRGVAGSAREAAGVQAADGLELPVGLVAAQRLQLRPPRLAHHRGVAVGSRRVQLPQEGLPGGRPGELLGCLERVGRRHGLGDLQD